jgi:hypothetical protein
MRVPKKSSWPRNLLVAMVFSSFCASFLQAAPPPVRSKAYADYERARQRGLVSELSADQDQYIRSNLLRQDLWRTVQKFQQANDVTFEKTAVIAILSDYLRAEEYQVKQVAGPKMAASVREKGQVALANYLNEIMVKEKVVSMDSFLAEELGKGAAAVPRRNKYGRLNVGSEPEGAKVYFDDGQDPVAERTNTGVIMTAGTHRVRWNKDGYRECTNSVLVESGQTKNISCRLARAQ